MKLFCFKEMPRARQYFDKNVEVILLGSNCLVLDSGFYCIALTILSAEVLGAGNRQPAAGS